ncbi:MAG: GDP-mannose 4,6-dehydratase [Candidatus Omnitrophica bacterium CG11_big_fil_rev_8_21_14_0_20_45_26]|uniref:GDP-mannose 4,6-dehydratase n=1 Tax=Candidatus Abzuiibacterium crystallinum TaxID=1974748 RepID=A0A2H0LR37_9BACT|nr:MAG: GDP-mannose 4,6-dehydratase [Candidatus Omnitrophica bacterium CG11_big_fil_rev_8_21_14_0_20_45_26]PIW64657.1 MAG: GDP-mannose 4,6-dehydratase [Candidatus Omnitrophica bacterium CG12_big_fil_rev_8_21_14_0_65_45_16]
MKRPFKRALITGIAGSGGSYLAEHIIQHCQGTEVHGILRWHSTTAQNNLANIASQIKTYECDLNDFASVFNVMRRVKPDVIFHLAAYANVRASFDNPNAVLSNNILATSNLFEAIRAAEIDPIIQLCSTSEVYGQVDPKDVPIKEEAPMKPSSPYAVSKVAQDLLGFCYFRSYGMKIIRTRMFAYFNPRRRDLFATSFARQVALIETGKQKELVHGNLDSIRTMIDVRDAMEAYWVATQYCEPGEAYNIGGTTSISVGEFLDLLKKESRSPIPSRVDPALLRPADVTLQIPDTTKFSKMTGWKPKYEFKESVHHLLEYWRERISAGEA